MYVCMYVGEYVRKYICRCIRQNKHTNVDTVVYEYVI